MRYLQDLQKGTKILSADGTTIQVAKVEKKKANKLVELERLGQSGPGARAGRIRFEDLGKAADQSQVGVRKAICDHLCHVCF